MSVKIIIGKNFGDEGKGLATDYFSAQSQKQGRSCLVIRHNGGGQAGHTVDFPDKRFVFHQLSSGSFRGADTYWDESFLPDLYKLPEELDSFQKLNANAPRLYAHPKCRCVYIDDVLVNMALETSRGNDRHGSCGMGINEAVERSAFPNGTLLLGDVCKMSARELYQRLSELRRTYLPKRLNQLGLSFERLGDYTDLLTDDVVLANVATCMHQASKSVAIHDSSIAAEYEDVLFEGAQGLLLDEYNLAFAPHLTTSRTGADNPLKFLKAHMPQEIPELVYVTRAYVTRHGAGMLPYEEHRSIKALAVCDATNVPNEWQGSLRFAPHGIAHEFFAPILSDVAKADIPFTVSCMITHLNETDGNICSIEGMVPLADWFADQTVFGKPMRLYRSFTPYADDITADT